MREISPGVFEGGEPAPADPTVAWDAFDFYRRFTAQERIAVRALAETDPIAADFFQTLNNTIASGSRVLSDDPDLLAGMQYLQAKPTGSPVLTSERAAQILA